VGIEL